MGLPHGYTVLSGGLRVRLCALALGLALQGCGLAIDAVQQVWPRAVDEVDGICARGRVHVGVAFEPLRPFVFPAIYTDEGPRVTGLDVELVREITAALSKRCGGRSIDPVLHLVHFRDLFVALNEGKLDLFVSAVSANVPFPARASLAYSIPYFYDGGLSGIAQRPEVAERVRARLAGATEQSAGLAVRQTALSGLTVAVQEGTVAQGYAEEHLKAVRLVLCDSLPAAFESEDPAVDVILGSRPILGFMVTRVRKDWQLLATGAGEPFLLTRDHFAVVMAEESYRLRWLVNDLIFQLEESGRLAEMRRRWLVSEYSYPRRAATEGLSFAAEKTIQHNVQGRCRLAPKG